jgi:hypothetical protein
VFILALTTLGFMSTLNNSVFIKIIKETTIFFTNIGDILLRVFCYTLLGVPKYKNH